MEPIKAKGAMRCKASAAWATAKPYTTQQITVDRAVLNTMRAVVGAMKCRAHADLVSKLA